jgi:hypothetical protein
MRRGFSLPLSLPVVGKKIDLGVRIVAPVFGGARSIIALLFKSQSITSDAAINDIAGELSAVEGTARPALTFKSTSLTTDAAIGDVAVTLGA